MRRQSVPEAIGLSVLDLVCGLFGLLVVLYAITERVDGSPGVEALPLKLVRIHLEGIHAAPVGIEIGIGGRVERSWPACTDAGAVTWIDCEPGAVNALIVSKDPIESVRFLLLGPPTAKGELDFADVKVWVTTPDIRRICTLNFTAAYRGDLEDISQCLET